LGRIDERSEALGEGGEAIGAERQQIDGVRPTRGIGRPVRRGGDRARQRLVARAARGQASNFQQIERKTRDGRRRLLEQSQQDELARSPDGRVGTSGARASRESVERRGTPPVARDVWFGPSFWLDASIRQPIELTRDFPGIL